jgi:hypothetical protein
MTDTKPNQLVECERDGFPILDINGQRHCLAEFVNYCIGGQKITDVVQRNDTLYYVFENRHELPLLCYCCGEPLACPDLQTEKRYMRGRVLQAMTWDTEHLEDGRDVIDFELEFSHKDGEGGALMVQTATLSANKMSHPVICPHSGLADLTPKALRPAIVSPPSKKRHKRK